MKQDDILEPKLGRIRRQKSAHTQRFLGRMVREISKAGPKKPGARLHGKSISQANGRSLIKGAGSAGGARVRKTTPGQRRVIVKARFVRIAGRGLGAMRAHLNYIARDGVTRDGDKGDMYGPDTDAASPKSFTTKCEHDRHQFRFIVAPEDGEKLEDLKPFVRDLMRQVETDLGTKLDWVAVDHFNTGHPHCHIVVRGKTDRNTDLVIVRDYVSYGFKMRAAELLTLELGPKTDIERVHDWRREVTAERFTGLDQELVRNSADNQVNLAQLPAKPLNLVRGDLLVQRLKKLESMNLATDLDKRRWRLSPQLETTLRRMGERGDIIKTMHHALADQKLHHEPQKWCINDEENPSPIIGKVVSRGLSDEHRDRHYLIIDGVDGQLHYVDSGSGITDKDIRRGAIVEVAANGARKRFADDASKPEPRQARMRVQLLSSWTLEDQITADGATWLDKKLLAPRPENELAKTDFGGEVRQALVQRQRWLMSQGLADEDQVGTNATFRPKPGLLESLRSRDLSRAASALAQDTSLEVNIARSGEEVTGKLIKRLDLVSGKFAVVDQSQSRGLGLTIAPWSSVLDRARGQKISGIRLGNQIRWTLAKDIGLEF